jgi:hypothetical protein
MEVVLNLIEIISSPDLAFLKELVVDIVFLFDGIYSHVEQFFVNPSFHVVEGSGNSFIFNKIDFVAATAKSDAMMDIHDWGPIMFFPLDPITLKPGTPFPITGDGDVIISTAGNVIFEIANSNAIISFSNVVEGTPVVHIKTPQGLDAAVLKNVGQVVLQGSNIIGSIIDMIGGATQSVPISVTGLDIDTNFAGTNTISPDGVIKARPSLGNPKFWGYYGGGPVSLHVDNSFHNLCFPLNTFDLPGEGTTVFAPCNGTIIFDGECINAIFADISTKNGVLIGFTLTGVETIVFDNGEPVHISRILKPEGWSVLISGFFTGLMRLIPVVITCIFFPFGCSYNIHFDSDGEVSFSSNFFIEVPSSQGPKQIPIPFVLPDAQGAVSQPSWNGIPFVLQDASQIQPHSPQGPPISFYMPPIASVLLVSFAVVFTYICIKNGGFPIIELPSCNPYYDKQWIDNPLMYEPLTEEYSGDEKRGDAGNDQKD